jgi:hypothetical protein
MKPSFIARFLFFIKFYNNRKRLHSIRMLHSLFKLEFFGKLYKSRYKGFKKFFSAFIW